MKVGYSFEGLVNRVTAVDESAVHKTRDETVDGLKTFTSCPASSGAQGAAGTHLTRRDFVLAELNKKVDLTGAQTIGGAKTFSSNLTAPAFLSSAEQDTAANAATRKDYVDAGLANKLNLSGGTMTGNLAAPTVLVSSAQNTSANALTRKDYVDTALNAKLNTAGGSVSGPLYVNTVMSDVSRLQVIHPHSENSAGIYWGNLDQWSRVFAKNGLLQITDGDAIWRVYHQGYQPTPAGIGAVAVSGTAVDQPITLRFAQGIYTGSTSAPLEMGHGAASSGNFYIDIHTTAPAIDYDYRWSYFTGSAGVNFSSKITAEALEVTSQGPGAASVARKDYVDGQIAKQVSKSGDTMTGALTTARVIATSSYAFVSALSIEHGMYLGNTASDTRLILGGGDTSTGYIEIRPQGISTETGRTVFNTNGTITNWTNPAIAGHLTNKGYVDGLIAQQVSKSGDTMTGNLTAPTVWVSSAQNASASALTRKDYVDAQVATRAPSSHTHNSSEITGGSTAILTGTIASGGTIPLPSGYTEAQCKWIAAGGNMQDPGNDMSNWRITTSGRVVTVLVDGIVVSGNYANYMIIGVK